ncbi:MAG: TonB family protein [Endomicrobium sp.]|jgi:TonB family protein|nr:TonB family protein [Endomicrobium sp.]
MVIVYFLFHFKEKHVVLYSNIPIEVSFSPMEHQNMMQSSTVNIMAKHSEKNNEFQRINNTTEGSIIIKEKKNLQKKQLESEVNNKMLKKCENIDIGIPSLHLDKHLDGQQFDDYNSQLCCDSPFFDDQNFNHYLYYKGQIIRKIEQQWRWVETCKKLRTLIYFKIHRDGSVSDILVKESSRDAEYDINALNTVRRAAPFPCLPENYTGQTLGVFFEFKYEN